MTGSSKRDTYQLGLYAQVGLTIDDGCKLETSHIGDLIELDMSGECLDAHLTITSAAVVRLIDALSVELEKFRSARAVQEKTHALSAVVTMSGNH
jgi:hypothetical protein